LITKVDQFNSYNVRILSADMFHS